MKRRLFAAVLSVVLLVAAFSGCSPRRALSSPEKLMRPPVYYGENEGLREAFLSAAEQGAILKSPLSGDYRSAFVLCDLDNDGQEEALAFYVRASDKTMCRLMVLKKIDAVWRPLSDIRGQGGEVYTIEFADMDGDGAYEIIIRWSLAEGSDRILSVYGFQDGQLQSYASEPVRAMMTIDIDQDGCDEILAISVSMNKAEQGAHAIYPAQQMARVLKMQYVKQSDGTSTRAVTALSEARLSGQASGFVTITRQQPVGGNPLTFYVDATSGDNGMFTEVLIWDAGKLSAPLGTETVMKYTYRPTRITARDINGDGYVEIPQQGVLDGSVDPSAKKAEDLQNATQAAAGASAQQGEYDPASASGQLSLTVWNRYSKGSLSAVMYSAINFSDSYMFMFKTDWISGNWPKVTNNITIVGDLEKRSWTFYDYDYATKVRGRVLFEIVAFPATELENRQQAGYIRLKDSAGLTYAAKLGDGAAERGVTFADIQNGLTPLG